MISDEIKFEIHSLYRQKTSQRQIAKILGIDRKSVHRCLEQYSKPRLPRKSRGSLLDEYVEQIDSYLEENPQVKAPAVLAKLRKQGYKGQIRILQSYLSQKRATKKRKSFLRIESKPGEQMQIDWGSFGSISYQDTARKLYLLSVVESHSRMLYIEFTHSQKQEALHQCLLNAFEYFGGTPVDLVVDNMKTAVIQRKGKTIQFTPAFLKFLLPFHIRPKACNVRAPHEKGKVERSISYVRQNFTALESFSSLEEANQKAKIWLEETANCRIHRTTGEKPMERFQKRSLRPFPGGNFDCREIYSLKVHPDFSIRLDGNTYSVSPFYVGKKLTVKSDQQKVSIYFGEKQIAEHDRSWSRYQRIEDPKHLEIARRDGGKIHEDSYLTVFCSYGELFDDYVKGLIENSIPAKKEVLRILELVKSYDLASVSSVLQEAMERRVFGADYVENLLNQKMTPDRNQPPVELKDQSLQDLKPNPLRLEDYNSFIFS